MQKKPKSFKEWIHQQGVHTVARTIGVTAATVRNWRRGAHDPELSQIRLIRKASRLSYEQIIDQPVDASSARGAHE